jgi:uncharacterized protein
MAVPTLPSDHVHERVAQFIAFLRERGVPAGIGAEVELGRAMRILPVLDRETVRQACGAILAKSPEERAEVETAFDLFFSPQFSRRKIPRPGQQSRGRRVLAGRGEPIPASPESEVEPPSGVTQFGIYSPQAPGAGHVLTPLSDRQMLTLRRGARRFRRRAATLPGRRLTRSRRGEVDFPETLRRSVGREGEWVELLRHSPRARRAELVVLWDVSGSMREHDALLFALVYSLERVSRTGRVFAFSTRVEEITGEIRRNGYARATQVVAGRIARAEGGTQIGPCLRQFAERYATTLGDRATVLVISDGWDRAESAAVAEELRKIRRRTHLVVWVSPYARRPGFEARTAGLVSALPYTDLLLGPEDFQSPFPLPPIDWKAPQAPATA